MHCLNRESLKYKAIWKNYIVSHYIHNLFSALRFIIVKMYSYRKILEKRMILRPSASEYILFQECSYTHTLTI